VPLPPDLALLVAAVALFRLLEALQRGPVRWASEVGGGARGALDDLVAGLITGTLLLIIHKVIYTL
jgi:phosphatidylglycerophosphatase A